jgi:hypothetical protein
MATAVSIDRVSVGAGKLVRVNNMSVVITGVIGRVKPASKQPHRQSNVCRISVFPDTPNVQFSLSTGRKAD